VFLRKQPLKSPAAVDEAGARREGGGGDALGDADIERLIEERAAARRAKNFKESDRIRDLLAAASVLLEDQPGGKTLWRRG
jgi:cysteinyl-tRNA synthetase